MDLRVVDDVPGAFASLVCDAWAARTSELFRLVLSGGDTARRCYERLAADSTAAGAIDWWKVECYWGDERCVPPDDPESNERLGREALLNRVGAAMAVHPMRCDDGADAYQLRLSDLDHFDVVHLGLGADGHTASLFPGAGTVDLDPAVLVVSTSDPSGTNPLPRMSLTLSAIAMARLIVVTVEGASKAAALAAVRDGDQSLPATHIRGDQVVWLADPAAARA